MRHLKQFSHKSTDTYVREKCIIYKTNCLINKGSLIMKFYKNLIEHTQSVTLKVKHGLYTNHTIWTLFSDTANCCGLKWWDHVSQMLILPIIFVFLIKYVAFILKDIFVQGFKILISSWTAFLCYIFNICLLNVEQHPCTISEEFSTINTVSLM